MINGVWQFDDTNFWSKAKEANLNVLPVSKKFDLRQKEVE
jgi:hypothetical protein